MSISPASISFTYKKGGTIPNGFEITHNQGLPDIIVPGEPYMLTDAPSWISFYDEEPNSFKIKINTAADSLIAGDHSIAINLTFTPGPVDIIETLYVDLELIDTQFLEIDPSSGNFNFTLGGAAPIAKVFNVLSESVWNITKNFSWITLSATSGSNNGSFNIGVDTTGLVAAVYNGSVTVDDGGTPIVIPISLTVSDPDTGVDYLNVYPVDLNFGFTEGGVVPPSQDIDINASASYTAVTAQNWIALSAASGLSGTSTIAVSLQNLGALAVGSHIGYVDLTLGTILKRVVVNLTIYQLVTETLTPGELYFCDDQNFIKVSSGRNDTSLLMNISAPYLSKNYSLAYNIPFFDGVASKRIGESACNIMGESAIFGMADINVIAPYQSVKLTIDINEVETQSNSILQSSSITNIKFIKGQKPTGNWLANLPSTLYLTKNATLIFSVLSNGQASGNLELTGDITQSIATSVQIFDFYTVVIPFKSLTLEVGHEFNVKLLEESINIVIIDDNVDHATLYVESQWGTFEPYELTGEVIEDKNYKDKSFTYRKNHLQIETKVFERKKRSTYKIDTGYIATDEMVIYLETILEGQNCYLQTSTGFRKVRNTTKKLQAKASLRESRKASLTFEDTTE